MAFELRKGLSLQIVFLLLCTISYSQEKNKAALLALKAGDYVKEVNKLSNQMLSEFDYNADFGTYSRSNSSQTTQQIQHALSKIDSSIAYADDKNKRAIQKLIDSKKTVYYTLNKVNQSTTFKEYEFEVFGRFVHSKSNEATENLYEAYLLLKNDEPVEPNFNKDLNYDEKDDELVSINSNPSEINEEIKEFNKKEKSPIENKVASDDKTDDIPEEVKIRPELKLQDVKYSTTSALYGVQVGAYENPRNTHDFPGVNKLDAFYSKPFYKYVSGRHNHYSQAESQLQKIEQLGYKDAFIVNINSPDYSKRVININRKFDNSTDEVSLQISDYVIKEGIEFKVQLLAVIGDVVVENIDQRFNQLGSLQKYFEDDQTYIMLGTFTQYSGAKEMKEDLVDAGFNDAFIVAFDSGKRIPVMEALKKSKK